MVPLAPFGPNSRLDRTPALSDIECFVLPNLSLAADELARGRIPLWNPYAGTGAPCLANEQSAVLHPFTLAGMCLPWRSSLTLIAVMRWLLAYLGVFVLARDLGLPAFACSFAAASHTLAGVTVVWMGYPVGAVFAHVPVLLWLARRHARGAGWGRAAALTAVLASTILSGHVEYLLVVWALTAAVWLESSPRRFMKAVPRLATCMGVAVLLAAAMLLPSVEYLSLCTSTDARHAGGRPLALARSYFLPAMVDPSFTRVRVSGPLVANGTNPLILASVHTGSLALALVFLAVGLRRWRRLGWLCLAAVLLLAGGSPARAIWAVPPLSWMTPEKLVALPILGVSLLAGAGAAVLAEGGAGRRAVLSLVAGVALCATIVALEPLLLPPAAALPAMGRLAAPAGAMLVAGLALLTLPARFRVWLLFGGLLAERALAFATFNLWQPPATIFPPLEIVERIRREVGPDRVTAAGDVLPPTFSTVYRLRDTRAYDGLGVLAYDQALRRDGNRDFFGRHFHLPSVLSRLAGARVLVVAPAARSEWAGQRSTTADAPELWGGARAQQAFRAPPGAIHRLALFVRTVPEPGTSVTVELRRTDGAPRTLASARLDPTSMRASGWVRVPVSPSVAVEDGAQLAISIQADGGGPGRGLVLGAAPRSRGPRLLVQRRPMNLALAFELRYGPDPRSRILGQQVGLRATVDDEALPRIRLASVPRDRSRIRIERDDPTRLLVRVDARAADRLVVADLRFPGWRCFIDGHPTRIESEAVFRAVEVPAGTHRVAMDYAPSSYQLGLFVTCMALCAGAIPVAMGEARPRGGHGGRPRPVAVGTKPE